MNVAVVLAKEPHPEELPKPEKKPELPGKDVPDAPAEPRQPEIHPEEKPYMPGKPQEVPAPQKQNL
ncbi:MAG: hypothetical protein BGO70_13895 [Bacteroidetes bacterium 43-93]|nr:hypothetical protein [Bacteroidota bacterium]OJW99524.1 MAG: hypothetical protein BGO70_13895 [Bacteroidetes bacterium 43-93]